MVKMRGKKNLQTNEGAAGRGKRGRSNEGPI